MGLGSLKDAPDVPDPVETAGFQTGTNIGTTLANAQLGNVKTATPYGTTTFKERANRFDVKYKDPYTGETYRIPSFKEKVKLRPGEKEQFKLQQETETNLLNLARDQSGRLGEYLSQPFSLGEFDFGADLGVDAYTPGASLEGDVYAGDPLKLGNEATEARLFELGSKRLDPRFAREKETLQSSLLSRGIREGTAAWNAAMGQFGEGQNDAYNQLLLTGRGQAAAETEAEWEAGLRGQGQTFGQKVAARNLGMGEQAQQFDQTMSDRDRLLRERGMETGEAFAVRNQPINEIAALLGGGQVTVPQLTGQQQPQAPITDVAGLINNNWEQQFKAWQAESQATQGLIGGALGAAGNIFSDRRIKDDIEQVGETPEGLPIYEFRVGDDGAMQSGVMAQDVEKVMPAAVSETPEGIKTVDYDMAVGAGDGTYTVQEGDNLWDIGQRFNSSVDDIVAANAIPNPDLIQPGQVLQIPGMAAPGPEAIRYDPLSSAGSGVAAVAEALQPADDIDMMTEVDAGGGYLMPPNVGGARPEFGVGGMPGALPAAPVDPLADIDQSIDQSMGEQASRLIARELMRNRTGMEEMLAPPSRAPGAGASAGPLYDGEPMAEIADSLPRVGTVGAGSTGGEFFSPQPPRGAPPVDPNAMRFTDTFDQPSPAMIFDLLSAWRNRFPSVGMAQPAMSGVGIGGF